MKNNMENDDKKKKNPQIQKHGGKQGSKAKPKRPQTPLVDRQVQMDVCVPRFGACLSNLNLGPCRNSSRARFGGLTEWLPIYRLQEPGVQIPKPPTQTTNWCEANLSTLVQPGATRNTAVHRTNTRFEKERKTTTGQTKRYTKTSCWECKDMGPKKRMEADSPGHGR